mmetsp:Transcript_13759/g.19266  ORF Transcript_13759/g.19266 Transcript_13759/m.19266 type:complete len:289 (-) Transcript_13759:29-895(-)
MGRCTPETPSSKATSTTSSLRKRSAASSSTSASKRARISSPETIIDASKGAASTPRNSVDSISTIGAHDSAGVLTSTATNTEAGHGGVDMYPDDCIEPDPESDPETAFDHADIAVDAESLGDSGGLGGSDVIIPNYATTVHWDPNSPEGLKVGYRIRIFDNKKRVWRSGRVLRYDPRSNKHKIQYYNNADKEVECVWLRLPEESTQCGSRFVWALVKGFAWWPAMVLECDPPMKSASKEGYVYVDFFGSDQFAGVKDTPDFIRPFDNGKIDDVIRKNKKKRNDKVHFV